MVRLRRPGGVARMGDDGRDLPEAGAAGTGPHTGGNWLPDVTVTPTSMAMKFFGSPMKGPSTGMACDGSRVTATRMRFSPATRRDRRKASP